MKTTFVSLLLLSLLPEIAWTCDLAGSSSWLWNENQLVNHPGWIVLIEVLNEDPSPSLGLSDYRVRVDGFLKSPAGAKTGREWTLKGLVPSNTSGASEGKQGRASLTRDCRLWVNLKVGHHYLLFATLEGREPILNARSLEEIHDLASDPWLRFVKQELAGGCKSDSDCSVLDCTKLDTPLKSPHQGHCTSDKSQASHCQCL